MVCKKCGNMIENESPFCYFCGEVFSGTEDNNWDKIDQKENEILEMNDAELNRRFANLIYTTTSNIEGHTIREYLGIVSGSVIMGTGFLSDLGAAVSDFFGTSSEICNSKLNTAREQALTQMKKDAILRGANAVVGIDMDIMTIGNNMFVVNLTGTAVIID